LSYWWSLLYGFFDLDAEIGEINLSSKHVQIALLSRLALLSAPLLLSSELNTR
jgi:hypothetical protein